MTLGFYKVYINDDAGLTMTNFTAMSFGRLWAYMGKLLRSLLVKSCSK